MSSENVDTLREADSKSSSNIITYQSQAAVATAYPHLKLTSDTAVQRDESDRVIQAICRVFTEFPKHDLIEFSAGFLDEHPVLGDWTFNPPCIFARVETLDNTKNQIQLSDVYAANTLLAQSLLISHHHEKLADAVIAVDSPSKPSPDVEKLETNVEEAKRDLQAKSPLLETQQRYETNITVSRDAVTIHRWGGETEAHP